MKLKRCHRCNKLLTSTALKIQKVKKKLSGNAMRKQYFWKVVSTKFICSYPCKKQKYYSKTLRR